MKLLIEAVPVPQDPETTEETVTLDVTGLESNDIAVLLLELQDVMKGTPCVFRWHECHHDEGQPCRVETIEV